MTQSQSIWLSKAVKHRNVVICGAVVLLAAVLGLAVADNLRPWKRLQLEFHELERRQLRSRLDAARAAAAPTLTDLEARVETQEALLVGRHDEIVGLEDDLRGFSGKSRAAELRRSRLESELALMLHRSGEAAGVELTEELRQTRMEIESLGELIADREGKRLAVRSDLEAAGEALAGARAPVEELEDRLAALPARPMLPLGGLFASGVAIREVALPASPGGPTVRVGGPTGRVGGPTGRVGGPTGRVDRCVTCHLATIRDDVETGDWPAPFSRHSALDLFLGADSPHPYPRFGCTTCHGGEGRATDFSRAGHVPVTSEQAARWQESRGWRPGGGRAMLPLDLTTATCGRCHDGEVAASQARSLERGRRLIAALGCTACHASGLPLSRENPPSFPPFSKGGGQSSRVGPSLIGIAGKTTPAWVHRWLEAPRDFRETTRMPHAFDPGEQAADAERSHRSAEIRSAEIRGRTAEIRSRTAEVRGRTAEIRAVVDYLWQVSRPADYQPPPAGEVEAGRTLFESVGCKGCHLLGLERDSSMSFERRHGPHLAGTGSKVDAGWLYAWLRDPRAYRHDTPMPSLRLDERQTADLTAYLMTRRDPAWEGLSLPATDVETRDRLVLSALARSHTIEQSQARFERMSERNKNLYLGEQTINRYGCHGCHQIAGFDQAPAVGPPLREVSGRLRARLASPEPASPKLASPGDKPATRGRWRAASHRPAYRLSDDHIRALTVAVLGLAGAAAPADDEATALAQGRRVVDRYNCRGCHRIEGRGGFPRRGTSGTEPRRGTSGTEPRRGTSGTEPRASPDGAPPDLAHAGARLKAPWLYRYLADPGGHQIRPWLQVRMPTFGLSAAENNALVRYFAALDDRPLFAEEPPAPRPAIDVAVGRVVFHLLQCGDCHRPASEEAPMPQLAPAYAGASERLRPDWVVALILDPQRWLPGTVMPANFLPDGGAEPSSDFLVGSINTPIFSVERDRLLRLLGSQEELHAYLSDPERVAAALRDYMWTLGK